MFLTPKNWQSFQHYKDRAPQWIKLHRALLDDFEFASLPVESRALAPFLWLLASEYDGGRISASLDELAFRLRMTRGDLANALNPLLEAGFFVSSDTDGAAPAEQVATLSQRIAKSNGFGRRHISDAVKRVVWLRDGGKCCECSSDCDIEYDHKVPVSKGGNSEEANIQLLCRPCNRKKRTRLAAPAEQVDTDDLGLRSLEKEEEREIEKRKNSRSASPSNEDFENFKRDYPKRAGNYGWKAAERKYLALVKTGVSPQAISTAVKRHAEEMRQLKRIGTEYVPMPAKWLNGEDFVFVAVTSFDEPKPIDWDNVVDFYKRTKVWMRDVGPDPESASCRAPPEILRKYGIQPTGASHG